MIKFRTDFVQQICLPDPSDVFINETAYVIGKHFLLKSFLQYIRRYSPSICKENLEKETVFIIKTEIFIKMSLFYN